MPKRTKTVKTRKKLNKNKKFRSAQKTTITNDIR